MFPIKLQWLKVSKTKWIEVDKLSNLLFSRFTSAALDVLEAAVLEGMALCQLLLHPTTREAQSVCFCPDQEAVCLCRNLQWVGQRPGVCVLDLRRYALVWPRCACLCLGAEASVLACSGSLQEICSDELMVAEHWCRRISEGGGEGGTR